MIFSFLLHSFLLSSFPFPGNPGWEEAPFDPGAMGKSDKFPIVLMTAPWCQWCRVLEHEVLPDPNVEEVLKSRYTFYQVNPDKAPLWMDLPDVVGLPTFVFFDKEGRHVLTKSGYRPAKEMAFLLKVVADRIEDGTLTQYAEVGILAAPEKPMAKSEAAHLLQGWESAVFMKINSNDGGFGTPARMPYPELLHELERWRGEGAPERVERWISLTLASALRGHSPRLEGAPLADLNVDAAELKRLYLDGPDAGPVWKEGIQWLPNADPYRGIQDQIDGGFFRYASGPGWYHPHFERSCLENCSWTMLMALRQMPQWKKTADFVLDTFKDGPFLNHFQMSDPFYYRLRQEERKGLNPPKVSQLWVLKTQARAARIWPERLKSLVLHLDGNWPRTLLAEKGFDPSSGPAPVDAVGELLLAMAMSKDARIKQATEALVAQINKSWREIPMKRSSRMFRLVAGLCEADPQNAGIYLAALKDLPLDLDHPPPFFALALYLQSEDK